MAEKIPVGILGCTGSVGQRFVQLLDDHPWFRVVALGASVQSAGKPYHEAVNWKQSTPVPGGVRDLIVLECSPELFAGCGLVFSGIDSSVAGGIEEKFARLGIPVFSNSRNHRCDNDVPLIVPEINADHLAIIPHQRRRRGWERGFIVTSANCSTTGLAIALKPILDTYGIEKLMAFTMQAVSGAGYPGLSSMDIIDNVIPYISGEEEKMETEPLKILGRLQDNMFSPADFTISAHCNRVAVLDGHTECVSLKLRECAAPEDIAQLLVSYTSEAQTLALPSAPEHPIVVCSEPDRPQPRLDRDRERGYSTSVGRIRRCPLLDIKFVLLSHNTVIGAAGGSILNAELARVKGYLD